MAVAKLLVFKGQLVAIRSLLHGVRDLAESKALAIELIPATFQKANPVPVNLTAILNMFSIMITLRDRRRGDMMSQICDENRDQDTQIA